MRLSLENGTLYVAWASHNDATPYHGWIVSWDVSQLATKGFQLSGAFNDSPNGGQAGFWEGGGTLAWELDGSAFYVETGNGLFNKGVTGLDANGFPVDGNYYNALLKIVRDSTTPTTQNINGWGMHVADYFIPYNSQALDTADQDFGSGGSMLLPDSAGIAGHPHLMVASGKQGKIYLVDRDNMGKFDPNNDHVVNAVPDGSGHNTPPVQLGGSLSTPAYYNGKIYCVSGYSSFAYSFTIGSTGALTATSQTATTFGGLPGSLVVSAAGTTNGIVWVMDRNANEIHAYDAGSFATELWNSGMKIGGGDSVGAVTKFASPTVADGEVFVGTLSGLVVYGNQPPASQPPAAPSLSASPLSNSSISLFWSDPSVTPNTATGYSIESSTDNVNFTVLTTAPGGSTTISVGGLSSNTTYYFRIRGFNGIGYSNYSAVATAATSGQVPALDFSSGFAEASPAKLTLNGSATINGSTLELTSGLVNQDGSAFSSTTVDVTKFNTQFTFHLLPGPNTSDGFCFVIEGLGPTALGADGGGLGYSGINHSVAVKFGTSSTTGVGPDATGEYTNGHSPNTNSIDLSSSGINLHNGDVFLVSATYDGTTLVVAIKDTNTGAVATQSYLVNIPQIAGGTSAYVGLTGSTGALTDTQDILAWTFTPGTPAAPAAPSALGAVPATATSVALSWTNNATNESGFQLDRANDVNFTQGLITLVLPASPSSYTDTANGIAPGSVFYYRIRATNNAGVSANSNIATVPIPQPPLTPTGAQVTGVTASEIDLSWTDNAGHTATGYLIQRRVGTGNVANYANLPALNATPPSTYTWSDVSITPGVAYEYHIVAYNTSGNIDFAGTNAISLTLPPAGLTATGGASSIALAWTPVTGAISYNVYRGTAAGAETLLASGVTSASYTDQTVAANTTYYYVVTAVNGNAPPLPDESTPSAEAEATTFVPVSGQIVNNLDSGPGSLRQALLDAAGTPGMTHTIQFVLPAGMQTITLLSPLPTATDPLIAVLDATQAVTVVFSSGAAWNNNNSLTLNGAGTLTLGGGIEGAGNLTVNSGSELTTGHINQNALVIGGAAGSPATVTIAASDATGDPLAAGATSAATELATGSGRLAALLARRLAKPVGASTSVGAMASTTSTMTTTTTTASTMASLPIPVAGGPSAHASLSSPLVAKGVSSDLANLIATKPLIEVFGVSGFANFAGEETEWLSSASTADVSSNSDSGTSRDRQTAAVPNGNGGWPHPDTVAAMFDDADILIWLDQSSMCLDGFYTVVFLEEARQSR